MKQNLDSLGLAYDSNTAIPIQSGQQTKQVHVHVHVVHVHLFCEIHVGIVYGSCNAHVNICSNIHVAGKSVSFVAHEDTLYTVFFTPVHGSGVYDTV